MASGCDYTIPGDAWSGGGAVGDEFHFWSHKAQKRLKKCSAVERISVSDADSIAEYQRTEFVYDNIFTNKLCLLDILTVIINYWKAPIKKTSAQIEHVNLYVWDKISITDNFLGYTAKEWMVAGIKYKQGSASCEIDLQEVI